MNRQERFQEAFNFLRHNHLIGTQKELAKRMQSTQPNISSALNGNPKVLTDSFLIRFNSSFDNIFNKNWLLEGKGEMLRSNITMFQNGDGGTRQLGHTENGDLSQIINPPCTYAVTSIVEHIDAQRKLTENAQNQTAIVLEQLNKAHEQISKSQNQIDRLLSIIEEKLK